MTLRTFAALLMAALLSPALAGAAEKPAAVLLMPESDMDRELADDLTEVLISAVLDKSDKAYRIEGKESFRKTLTERKASSGDICVKEVECVGQAVNELGLELVLFGRVGKAANGYRLEVWHLAAGTETGKPYRKRVEGDVGKLIEEMELVATWAMKPRDAMLTVTVEPDGAAVTVDGEPAPAIDKPFPVSPGAHVVAASAEGFVPGETSVECEADQPCTAALALVAVKPDKPDTPDKPIEPPPQTDTEGPLVSTGTIVTTAVLGAVALGAGGGAAYMFTRMKAAEGDANDLIDELCPDGTHCTVTEEEFFDQFDPITDRGSKNALWTNVLGGVAAASAVAAVTILVIDLADGREEAPARTSFTPVVGPDFSGVSFGLTF